MHCLSKPPSVHVGDTVAVVSPASGAVGRWPHRVERARAYLESIGLRVRLMPNAARNEGWASAPPEPRVEDIHQAFLDDEVGVVLAGTGGNHSNQLLPLLDYDLIRAHPKVFQGYSDITVLHWALAKHSELSTFYGPALVPELGEYPQVFGYTDRYLRAAWFDGKRINYLPSDTWTDERVNWDAERDLERPRELRKSEGWISLRDGIASGPLLGGCLETICWHLKGSRNWIDPSGAILLLELSEEAPSPASVDAYLTDLEQLGVFHSAAGLLFATPYGYTPQDTKLLWEVVTQRTEDSGVPVLVNIEAGHTDPMMTLPLGCPIRVNSHERRLELLEAPTTAE